MGATKGRWLCAEAPSMDYHEALELQRALVDAKTTARLSRDVLMLLEHPPVFTLGRRGSREHLLVAEAFLESRRIRVVHAERGGDITYHGPGQLVGYPVVDLRKGRWKVADFVGALEEVMIRTVADWGIRAGRDPMNRGVWVGTSKMGSVGIAVRRAVSFHGFALNVNTSLAPFSWIHPCGLQGVHMTSMQRLLGKEISIKDVRCAIALHIQEIFGVEMEQVSLEEIYLLLGTEAQALGREMI
jgi:lipoate-protein ligase B